MVPELVISGLTAALMHMHLSCLDDMLARGVLHAVIPAGFASLLHLAECFMHIKRGCDIVRGLTSYYNVGYHSCLYIHLFSILVYYQVSIIFSGVVPLPAGGGQGRPITPSQESILQLSHNYCGLACSI